MAAEMGQTGFSIINQHAVEGCIWFTPCLDEKWENKEDREKLLSIIHMKEHDTEMMGMSLHFIIVGEK